jgi:hypothetical protein
VESKARKPRGELACAASLVPIVIAFSTSIRDLMRLFGNLQEDDNERSFSMVDNPNPRHPEEA